MTSEKDQIQTLIAEIDTFLSKSNPRLPWERFSEADQQRQILAKTQRYLIALQQSMQAPGGWGPIDPETGALSPVGAQERLESVSAESAQQVLQAVLQEMQYLRTNLLQPLRLEIDRLHQERQTLQQEVRQLEVQRLQADVGQAQGDQLQMISDLLQVFMERLQHSLAEQIAQALAKLKSDAANNLLLEEFLAAEVAAADWPRLHPSQRLDQLRTVQAQSDQLLLKLDSTLKVVFETLQNNIHSYQESLSQGLSKMHGLGSQGEAIVTALITHLAQQLGQETSKYLDSGLDSDPESRLESGSLPGEAAIQNRLLAFQDNTELAELEDTLPISESWEAPSVSFESGELDLDLEDLDLDDLDIDIDDDDEIGLFQVDPESPLLSLDEVEGEDIRAFSDDPEPTLIQHQSGEEADASDALAAEDPLDLLSQLRDVTQADEAANPDVLPEASSEPDISSDLKELDEFYQNLFGADGVMLVTEVSEADTATSASLDIGDELGDESPPELGRQAESLAEAGSENFTLDDFRFEDGADSEVSDTQAMEESLVALSEASSDPQAIIDSFFGEILTQEGLDVGLDLIPDTISSLAELLPGRSSDPAAAMGQTHNQSASSDNIDSLDIGLSDDLSDTGWDSDTYIPAPPEEELLVSEEPEEDSGLNLDLVDPALQQLMNEELSSLEGLALTEPSCLDLEFQTTEVDDPLEPQPDLPAESASGSQPTDFEPDGEASQQALLVSIVHELGIPDALPDSSEDDEDGGLTLQKLIETEAQQRDEIALSHTDEEEITLDSLEDLSLADFVPEVDRLASLSSAILATQDLTAEDLKSSESLKPEGLAQDAGFLQADSTGSEDRGEGLILSADDLSQEDNIEGGLSLQNVLEEVAGSAQQTSLLEGDEITLESLEALHLEDLMPGAEAGFGLEAEFVPEPDVQLGLEESTLMRSDLSLDEPVTDEAANFPGLSHLSDEERGVIPDDLAEALSAAPEGESPDNWAQLESALVPDLPDVDGSLDLGLDQQSQPPSNQTLETNITSDTSDQAELEALLDEALAAEFRSGEWTDAVMAGAGPYRGGTMLEPPISDPTAGLTSNPSAKLETEAREWVEENLEANGDDAAGTIAAGFDPVEDELAGLESAVIDLPPSAETKEDIQPQQWFLGIDFGATGLSAVLMDRVGGDAYPIYWVSGNHQGSNAAPEKLFRLPAIAYLAPTSVLDGGTPTSLQSGLQVEAVGPTALKLALDRNTLVADEAAAPAAEPGLLLRSFKSLLKVGIPFYSSNHQTWEPAIQWSDSQQVPLNLAQESLQAMLQTLWAIDQPGNPAAPNSTLVCGAIGLAPYRFKQALDALQGVIIGYPANWPDTYSFNIREALLAAQLVIHPEQIFFVEDGIAVVLSGLRNPLAEAPAQTLQTPHQQGLYNCDWQGGTIVINAGASLTELTLVDLPQTLQELTYADFSLRSFAYAGDAIDQDIICQLLYPSANRQMHPGENPTTASPTTSDAAGEWAWQAALPESAQADWRSLGLESLELPRSGEPELINRQRLQKRLEESLLGRSLLEAARHLKLILQHQLQFQLELGGQRWIIRRKGLESRIFLPYIQRVNRQLNILLSQTGFSPQAINQVICTGGLASLAAIARWLRQKFPNATIIQDTYPSDRPASCSRVAYGLVNLARYPQVLDIVRQQYSDYFLLLELIRNFPDQPLPISGIMHLLEERGINTKICYNHILALLEGHLPPGLLPTQQDLPLLSERSLEIGNYQALGSTSLFTKQGGQIYVPNLAQRQRLSEHLEVLMANKHQTLEEPLIAQLAPAS